MHCVLPIRTLPVPLGEVTARAGASMTKSTSLTSATESSPVQRARILACEVGGPSTRHGNVPDVADAVGTVVIGLHVAPPSRLTSRSTLSPTARLCVNVIACVLPITHAPAALGAVTVNCGLWMTK